MMAFFDWTDDLKIGVPLIDEDHSILVDLISQLHNAIGSNEERANLGSVLSVLVDYTVYHFRREEKVLAAVGYERLDDHREVHEQLAQRVLELDERFRSDPDSVIGEDVMEFLKDWLTDHILVEDKAFAPLLAGHEAAAAAAAGSVPRMGKKDEEADAVDWTGLSVLIVDDNVNFRRVIRTILDSVNTTHVEEAENGAEALEALHDFRPDAVLCDWRMDEMDGLEFVAALRNGEGAANICCPNVPVIMMTGFGDEAFRRRAIDAGVTVFLEKPITARGVLSAVAKAVSVNCDRDKPKN